MKNKYEINGDTTNIFISRRNGKIISTIIDTADLIKADKLRLTWCVSWNKYTNSYYVVGHHCTNNKRTLVPLARWLLDEPKGHIVDHINHDTLDNRRSNLRIVSQSQNQQNRKGPPSNNSTGYRGVYYDWVRKRYRAFLIVEGRYINIGRYADIETANEAVKKARAQYMPYSEEATNKKRRKLGVV